MLDFNGHTAVEINVQPAWNKTLQTSFICACCDIYVLIIVSLSFISTKINKLHFCEPTNTTHCCITALILQTYTSCLKYWLCGH